MPGHSHINKYGHNDFVSSSLETVWSNQSLYVFPDAASIVSVQSSDADDTVGGNGVWNITIIGLDGDYNPINETIQMNGTSVVNSTQQFLRVNRAYAEKSGSTGTNEGDIWIFAGGSLCAMIDALLGQTEMAVFTIPANTTGYMTLYRFTSDADRSVLTGLIFDYFEGSRRWQSHIHLFRQIWQNPYEPYKVVPAKTDIMLVAATTPQGAAVSGEFDIILVEDGFNLVEDDTGTVNNLLLFVLIVVVLLIAIGLQYSRRRRR